MTTTLASSLFQRDLNFALSSGSSSPSTNASASPRHATRTRSVHHANISSRDGYFEEAVYDSPDTEDKELLLRRLPRRTSANHGDHWDAPDILVTRNESFDSSNTSPSQSVSSLGSTLTSYNPSNLLYDRIIDTLTSSTPNPFTFTGARNFYMFDPSKDETLKTENVKPLMIKRLKNSSTELQILYSTHKPPLRDDPWNAAPHIAGVVERGDWVYVCMEQLSEYNQPPLVTVEHYIDFFCQVLERLTFLHEHGISGLSLSDPSSYMVDISSCPTTPGESTSFDRFKYPVHYYFVNFSKATRLPRQLLYVTPTPVSSTFEKSSSLAQDVRDCGVMLAKLIEDVPQISETFAPLLEQMSQGYFTMEHFESLLASMDKNLFETKAVQPSTLSPGRHSSETNIEPEKRRDDPVERPVSH